MKNLILRNSFIDIAINTKTNQEDFSQSLYNIISNSYYPNYGTKEILEVNAEFNIPVKVYSVYRTSDKIIVDKDLNCIFTSEDSRRLSSPYLHELVLHISSRPILDMLKQEEEDFSTFIVQTQPVTLGAIYEPEAKEFIILNSIIIKESAACLLPNLFNEGYSLVDYDKAKPIFKSKTIEKAYLKHAISKKLTY